MARLKTCFSVALLPEFPVKHEAMNKRSHGLRNLQNQFVLPPAYPFHACDLFEDLRSRLTKSLGRPIGFGEMGEMMGRPKGTAHFWISVYRHPHLIAFSLLWCFWKGFRRNKGMHSWMHTARCSRRFTIQGWSILGASWKCCFRSKQG